MLVHKFSLIIFKCLIVSVSFGLLLFNFSNNHPYYFNNFSKVILNHYPSIYNPYSATFYCRTLHIDGAYNISEPAYYKDSNGSEEIRKIIFLANPQSAKALLNNLIGNKESLHYLENQINKHREDGKFHYINFPRKGKYQLKQRPFVLELNHEVCFDNTEEDAHKYFTFGMSATETNFAWTDGKQQNFRAYLPNYKTGDLKFKIYVKDYFYHPQHLIIKSCDNTVLMDSIITTNNPIIINIPNKCIDEKIVELSFELPDAISPKSIGQSADDRDLGIAIYSFCIEQS